MEEIPEINNYFQGINRASHLYHNNTKMVWLFNGISTFVGYLIPKPL